ncbi:MAG: ATP-binding protein [Saprospiraceae bacterium]|nr:ATP-binding protein [Saprospiraceae bacterium]
MSSSDYISRKSRAYFNEVAKYYPILSVSGPRQAGKTSFIREMKPDFDYITFEDPDIRQLFYEDPRSFLEKYDHNAVFDEAQNIPELFSYLQGMVDKDRRPCRFILTGSQNYLMQHNISQSLAGRIGLITLLPLQLGELKDTSYWTDDVYELMHRGFYPGCIVNEIPTSIFYKNYISTILERDISDLIHVSSKRNFRLFIKLCANYAGNMINLTNISNLLNVSATTVSNWLSILESSYIIYFLQPYFQNFEKRIVKTPKLYFYDTGLLCHLLGIKSGDALFHSKHSGHVFENFVITEKYKKAFHNGDEISLYFLRDSNGVEVDVVEEMGDDNIMFQEIKSTSTFNSSLAKNLNKFQSKSLNISKKVIYNGENLKVNDVVYEGWKELV